MVSAVGHGIVHFERESMQPLYMRDVLYVPRLKKNLVSVSMMEERGFGVYVLDGKVHIFSKAAGPSNSCAIGVRCGKLYKLLFKPHHTLSHTQSSSELCELWHRRMAHLHHPALRMLREMTTSMPEFNTESSQHRVEWCV